MNNIPNIHEFPDIPKKLPPFPSRVEVMEFNEKMNLFLDSMPQFVESVNKFIDYLNDNRYISHWAANITYCAGDKVKYDGICYIATDECNKPGAESNINKVPDEMDNNFWRKDCK